MTAPSPLELAAKVRAGIARERQQAQAATPDAKWGRWQYESARLAVRGKADYALVMEVYRLGDLEFYAAHDPARVLADCDRAASDVEAWLALASSPLSSQVTLATFALARLAATYGGEG